MIDVRVDKGDSKLSMEGNLQTITAEFFMLAREVYRGIAEAAGEIPAQCFRKKVLAVIGTCFETDEEIAARAENPKDDVRNRVSKLLSDIDEMIEMFGEEKFK